MKQKWKQWSKKRIISIIFLILAYHLTEKKISNKPSKYIILDDNTRAVAVMLLKQM